MTDEEFFKYMAAGSIVQAIFSDGSGRQYRLHDGDFQMRDRTTPNRDPSWRGWVPCRLLPGDIMLRNSNVAVTVKKMRDRNSVRDNPIRGDVVEAYGQSYVYVVDGSTDRSVTYKRNYGYAAMSLGAWSLIVEDADSVIPVQEDANDGD